MTPCMTSKNIELLRKKAKELNPQGVPLPLQVSFPDHFQSLMQEVRREGASKTPFGRGFKANHALKKELDI